MKPYYEESGIQIWHGDCREILPTLPAALIVTDPPYNIGYHYAGYVDKLATNDYQQMLVEACLSPCVVIHYAEDLCALSWTLKQLPEKIVAWVYPSNTARQWRGIAWFGCKPDFTKEGQPYRNPDDARIAKRISNGETARLYDWWEVDQVKNVGIEKTAHPCQIPLAVKRRILRITDGDLIIDPFAGSGTTLRAAKDLGRKAIGIEIEEKYCEIAAKRLSQQVLDFEATA